VLELTERFAAATVNSREHCVGGMPVSMSWHPSGG